MYIFKIKHGNAFNQMYFNSHNHGNEGSGPVHLLQNLIKSLKVEGLLLINSSKKKKKKDPPTKSYLNDLYFHTSTQFHLIIIINDNNNFKFEMIKVKIILIIFSVRLLT